MRNLPFLALSLCLSLSPAALAASPAPSASPVAGSPAPVPSASPTPPAVSGLRVQTGTDTLTLTIELPHAVVFEERATAERWKLFLPGLSAPASLGVSADPVLGALSASNEAGGATFELPWRHWCPTSYEVSDSPARVSVTFRKRYVETSSETLAPGVVHLHRRSADANGPLNVHVLKVDPKAPGVKVQPGMAGGFFARHAVSRITEQHGALAGINGAYFSMRTGEPVGLLMIDRELIAAPLYNRSALVLGADGSAFIGNTQLSNRLVLPTGESYDFDAVNGARGLNRMVLYTERFGATTRTEAGGREFSLLPDGTVLAAGAADSAIPFGGYVISAHGQAADWLGRYVKVGQKLSIRSPLADFWPGARHALGGGPTLLREGKVAITAFEEQFKPDITDGVAPRTAVGVMPDGQLLLVTVDGRLPKVSRGLSLAGLAYLLQQLGADHAMNLDGGGSTAMAIGPTAVNWPSDGRERPVNNALLVFGGAPQVGKR